jgi:thiamine-phosphate pyrophosphorylase
MIAYAITDPSTLRFNTLENDLRRFSKHADMIVYRDIQTSSYEKYASLFLSAAKGFKKVLLHSDYQLAHNLGADGVHLKSTQIDKIQNAKRLDLFVVVSTHTKEEVLKAEALGSDMVTLSPIFYTPNKGLPLGLEKLSEIVSEVSIPVIALGGVLADEQIENCIESGATGFASIRYFDASLMSS